MAAGYMKEDNESKSRNMKAQIRTFVRSYVEKYQKNPEIHTKWGKQRRQ